MKFVSRSLCERFHEKYVVEADGCWRWIAGKDGMGYGLIVGEDEEKKKKAAHRVSYELHRGPVPEGLVVQTCGRRDCVNPAHLVVQSQAERRRRDRCPRGHELSGENLYLHPGSSKRGCRQCRREQARRRYVRRTAEQRATALARRWQRNRERQHAAASRSDAALLLR